VTRGRDRELRLAVRPHESSTPAAVAASVTELLGPGWTVRPLAAGSDILVLTRLGPAPAGTPEHARASHEAAYTLLRSGRFVQVEADVPVRGYADQEQGHDPAGLAVSDLPLDWPRLILRWSAALDLMDPAVRGGVGVLVGQPDTGYSVHPNLGLAGLDLDHDRDVIDGDDDAADNLGHDPLYAWPFVGHGTSTASVVVGHGPPDQGIQGLLSAGKVVPVRATESVIQVFDTDVAQAVAWARQVGCHVITMSLGGKGLFGLHAEIQRAVDAGLIVMAAAGNYVRFVTAPASYDNCLAVAATGPGDERWDGSSRGPAVDVAMPGAQVPVARWDLAGRAYVAPSDGTSFAVAHLAAAAGLWLAHHGRDALIARFGAPGLQAAFLATLHQPGVCVRPPDWDDDWGIGRVDLVGLLQAPLPAPAPPPVAGSTTAVPPVARSATAVLSAGAGLPPPGVDTVVRIARALGRPEAEVRARLGQLLEAADDARLDELLRGHEGELVYLAYADASFAEALSSTSLAPVDLDVHGVSGALAARLRRVP
jgi:hypothetical protein